MAAKPRKPEPLRPGDEQIAREEIEGYYAARVEQARTELAAAQERYDQVKACVDIEVERFRAGERLADIDAWSIEMHAGGVDAFNNDVFAGNQIDREAYDQAMTRRAATKRWLRHEGYEELH